MSEMSPPHRNWKEIARELAHEQNPSKCLELSHELNKAITEEERKGGPLFTKDEFTSRDHSAS